MRKIFAILAVSAALPLAACNAPEDRAAGGALLGGATGAVLGAAVTGTGGGALAGGAIGAASGAVIGATTTPTYGSRRVYAEEPVYVERPRRRARMERCWTERQPVYNRWGRVVGSRRVEVCG